MVTFGRGMCKADNGTLYMIFNESDENRTFDTSIKDNVYVFDAENGKIFKPNLSSFTVPSGKMLFLWQGDVEDFEKEPEFSEELILEKFTFRRSSRFVIGDMEFETESINEDEIPAKLGDWSEYTGKDFSGSGIYKTDFSLPENSSKLYLDLGDVRCSCEVFVNNESIGVKGMCPYTFDIPESLLKKENVLEIRVTNTGANEYLYTKSFDKWQPWQLTPYRKTENIFHEDSLAGGLYGPVKILY